MMLYITQCVLKLYYAFDSLPSSVNVQLLVRGPNPAEVLAFIEIL